MKRDSVFALWVLVVGGLIIMAVGIAELDAVSIILGVVLSGIGTFGFLSSPCDCDTENGELLE